MVSTAGLNSVVDDYRSKGLKSEKLSLFSAALQKEKYQLSWLIPTGEKKKSMFLWSKLALCLYNKSSGTVQNQYGNKQTNKKLAWNKKKKEIFK